MPWSESDFTTCYNSLNLEISAMPLSQMFDKVFDKISFDEKCMKAGKTEQKIDFPAHQKDR